MAKNQVFKFVDILSLPVAEGVKSGDPVVINADTGLVGVAETNRNEADSLWGVDAWDQDYAGGNGLGHASVSLKGAYRLEVTGVTAVGTPVYAEAAADGDVAELSVTADVDSVLFGHALTTKGAAAGPVTVRIKGGN